MRNPFLFLLLVIVFFACQKDDNLTLEEAKNECRLTKIIQGVHNGAADDTTFTFNYDSKGLLSKITTTTGYGDTTDWIIHYNSQNRLVKLDGPRQKEFIYNSNGLLSELHYSKLSAKIKIVFEYGADSVPLSAREYWLAFYTGGQWQEQQVYRYTYQNGNIVSAELSSPGLSAKTHYFEYYDNIPNNKELSLIDPEYIGLGFYEHFSFLNKNMLKKANHGNYGHYFKYTIDSGNIIKSLSSWLDQNQIDTTEVATRFFYYDCQ